MLSVESGDAADNDDDLDESARTPVSFRTLRGTWNTLILEPVHSSSGPTVCFTSFLLLVTGNVGLEPFGK